MIDIGKRWWWLLILAPLVAGSVAFFQVSRQQEMYRASSTVEINPPSMGADTFSYYDPSIVATYRELITTSTVLQPLIEDLELPLTESALRSKISTEPVENTRLMRISVTDPDPVTAAALSNAIATAFAAFAEERTEELAGPYREALDQQIAKTNAQIETKQQLIDDLQASNDAETSDVTSQIQTLENDIIGLQSTVREFLVTANRMDLESASAQTGVVVVQNAFPPAAPYAPDVKLYTLLAAFAGLCIAVGAIALYEYLDNTTKSTTPYIDVIGAPLLATVPLIPHLGDAQHEQLFMANAGSSQASEAVRLLRTNIEFASAGSTMNSISVTSSGPGDGKSTIVANLALAMAQAGYRVALIDADLRKPSLHKVFHVRNDRGLSNLLIRTDTDWHSVARQFSDSELYLVTSGPIPPNPADLLRSEQLRNLVESMESEFDAILIDTPPALAASDALLVASAVDGVIIVSRANTTRIEKLVQAVDALPDSARIVGLLLNQQVGNDRGSYYYYYSSDDESGPGTKDNSLTGRIRSIFNLGPSNDPATTRTGQNY